MLQTYDGEYKANIMCCKHMCVGERRAGINVLKAYVVEDKVGISELQANVVDVAGEGRVGISELQAYIAGEGRRVKLSYVTG